MKRKIAIILAFVFGALFIGLAFLIGFDLISFLIGAFLIAIGIAGCLSKKDTSSRKEALSKEYSFNVAGVSYRQDAIRDLCFENEDYSISKKELIDENLIDEPIYKYEESTLELISLLPDPDNEYDKNAIKVMQRDNLLGYVPKEETDAVRKIVSGPYEAAAKVYGGPYKTLLENGDDDGYTIEKEDQNVGLRVTIKY